MAMGSSWSRDPQGFQHTLANAGLHSPKENCWRLVRMHIIRPIILVNIGCVMLGRIIAQILLSGLKKNLKYFCILPSKSQKYCISIAWEHCCLMVLLTMPTMVMLLICLGVSGCGCWSSARVRQRTLACWAYRKREPNSASAVDTATSLSILQVMSMVPLSLIGLPSTG